LFSKIDFVGSSPQRAMGMLFKNILDLSSEELVGNSIEDYIKAMNLSIERGIDITDALFSCYRNKDEKRRSVN
jgi:hypothetical protein